MSDNESDSGISKSMTLAEFRKYSKQYLEVQNRMDEIKEEMKDLKTRSKVLSEKIEEFMLENDYLCVNIGDEKIELQPKERATPLGKKKMFECFTTFLHNETRAKELQEYLQNQRQVKEYYILKRI